MAEEKSVRTEAVAGSRDTSQTSVASVPTSIVGEADDIGVGEGPPEPACSGGAGSDPGADDDAATAGSPVYETRPGGTPPAPIDDSDESQKSGSQKSGSGADAEAEVSAAPRKVRPKRSSTRADSSVRKKSKRSRASSEGAAAPDAAASSSSAEPHGFEQLLGQLDSSREYTMDQLRAYFDSTGYKNAPEAERERFSDMLRSV